MVAQPIFASELAPRWHDNRQRRRPRLAYNFLRSSWSGEGSRLASGFLAKDGAEGVRNGYLCRVETTWTSHQRGFGKSRPNHDGPTGTGDGVGNSVRPGASCKLRRGFRDCNSSNPDRSLRGIRSRIVTKVAMDWAHSDCGSKKTTAAVGDAIVRFWLGNVPRRKSRMCHGHPPSGPILTFASRFGGLFAHV